MYRFVAIGVGFLIASSASASPSWSEALQGLKNTAATGDRAEVAETLKSLYQQFESNEKAQSQLLNWGSELLEIFNTQKGLDDFERAKSLREPEPDLALELLQRSLESEPNHPRVLALMADIHLRRKDLSRAKSVVQKLVTEYPLWELSHIYELRIFAAAADVQGLKDVSTREKIPFGAVKDLAHLLYGVYSSLEESRPLEVTPPELEAGLKNFSEWPEVTYLGIQLDATERPKWVAKFLSQCSAAGEGAALPNYPSAVCQRSEEVKELTTVNQEDVP